jgi:hypothetical protein
VFKKKVIIKEMKVIKVVDVDPNVVKVNTLPFKNFAETITKEMLNDDNESNKVLCRVSAGMKGLLVNPKVFLEEEPNKIYCLEFIAGVEEVLLKELKYECDDIKNKETYVLHLIHDKNRVWNTKVLRYMIDKDIPNQVLTLLRLCKVDKEEYKKNPDVLSKRFSKKK